MPEQGPTIEFVNHAAVLMSDGQCGLLTDPWLFGDAFHHGWALLTETPDGEITRLLDRTTHIWLSHEHPDHFSPAFFQRFREEILAHGIEVLFQKTRDGRVAGYLRSLGLPVVELAAGRRHDLHERFSLWIEPSDLYDSALVAQIGDVRVFNINDCPMGGAEELAPFARKYGTCDVLLTQFSYAAWKGGRNDVQWRQKAARNKIASVHKQIEAFKPASCILFASFVRFANEMNCYLNDAVNHPDRFGEERASSPARLVFMAPGEVQPLDALAQSAASLDFWRARYAEIASAPLMRYSASESIESLTALFAGYRAELFRRNNGLLMRLARDLLPFHPLRPTVVHLTDLGLSVRTDPFGTLSVVADGTPADIGLHSSSLAFCFRHPFGVDTLFVNGCFEELSPGGFGRFAKCFGIGNMNAAGVAVAFSALGRLDVVRVLLRKLRSIQAMLARNKPARA